MSSFDVQALRADFPTLDQQVYEQPLAYLDNAATAHKPRSVLKAIEQFYANDNANVHRGVHALSERADKAYEAARDKVRDFIHAKASQEIIFTRGTTESINLVAQSFGQAFIEPGDEILITAMEHHSNIVPWQLLCERTGAKLVVAPITDQGELDLAQFEQLLNARTKLVSVVHISNTLGTINPIKTLINLAHAHGSKVLIDAAQSIGHIPLDVQALDCDFLAFSAHKMYGPTGIGVLYGKTVLLEQMPPYQGGGSMIASVAFEQSEYNQLPYKFEAGTPNIAGVIGLGAAVDYINRLDRDAVQVYEQSLLDYAHEKLAQLPGLRFIGEAACKACSISFVLDKAHPHDIATILDRKGIAIRAGHHCTMPLMKRFAVPATARASFSFYNTFEEVDRLVAALRDVQEMFA